jgi:hypothetical protein
VSGSGAVPHWSSGQRKHLRPCGRRPYPIITIKAEQEHLIERRAGKYHPLRNCWRPGVALDEQGAAILFGEGQSYPEPAARRRLADVATGWRDLLEHIR